MLIVDVLLFLAKYTPFWGIPLGLISFHFAYLFWLKDYKQISYFWSGIVFFCLVSILIYFLMGGPDQITLTLTRLMYSN